MQPVFGVLIVWHQADSCPSVTTNAGLLLSGKFGNFFSRFDSDSSCSRCICAQIEGISKKKGCDTVRLNIWEDTDRKIKLSEHVFWWWGNRITWRRPMQAQGDHAHSTQEDPAPAGNQTLSLLPTRQLCHERGSVGIGQVYTDDLWAGKPKQTLNFKRDIWYSFSQ